MESGLFSIGLPALIIFCIIVLIIIVLVLIVMYNGLINKKNQIFNAQGSVDAMLKKRFDLIPNLVETCKVFMQHESTIFSSLANLRSESVSGSDIYKRNITDQGISKSVNGLFAVAENYPELKSSQNFIQLQAAWNETEEQIAAARRFYNSSVTDYNNSVEMFPSNIMAKLMGLKQIDYFSIPNAERENVSATHLFKR